MEDFIIERKTKEKYEAKPPKGAVFLYDNLLGRFILFFASKRFFSVLVGKYLDTKMSRRHIEPFIKNNNIDMSIYEKACYQSFNEFFARKLKKDKLHFSNSKRDFLAPASSSLLVYDINLENEFVVKNKKYTLEEILRNSSLANEYKDGYFLSFRLGVDDYHRYHFIDDAKIVKEYKINGKFNSVGPIAFKRHKIYSENQREYQVLKTSNFGKIIYMEIGALMVGKICNHNVKNAKRGEEKGYFLYGGSTIVLIVKKDVVKIDEDILENSKLKIETKVSALETIGTRR